MSLRFPDCVRGLLLAGTWLVADSGLGARDLTVCADPEFLPYSNDRREGFENRIVELVASELGDRVVYRWQPLRRGLIRKTLESRACDVLAGVPLGIEGVATTAAYYRSSYVLVSRRSLGAPIVSYRDPRLRDARIGVQLIGADMAAMPAALALAAQGIMDNVTGFPLYGAQPAAQRMVEAIDAQRLDVAIAWGPQIGYFAARAATPLVVGGMAQQPFMTFAIALAVREDDGALRDRLDGALARVREPIAAVLAQYDVPLVEAEPGGTP